jgi:hypothetical protein
MPRHTAVLSNYPGNLLFLIHETIIQRQEKETACLLSATIVTSKKRGRGNPRPVGAQQVCQLLLVADIGDTCFLAVSISSVAGGCAVLTVGQDDNATGNGNLTSLLLGQHQCAIIDRLIRPRVNRWITGQGESRHARCVALQRARTTDSPVRQPREEQEQMVIETEIELETVNELAELLRMKPSCVFDYADDLGAFRLGKYLRFSLPRVMERLERGDVGCTD